MEGTYEVLVMRETDGAISFEQAVLPESKLPEIINGESGHHICYVMVLTELIAKQLVRMTDRYDLDDAAIRRIALASSLHDIGKTRIPRAIIEKKGTLTPGEYDIVKKHTILGWELIRQADDASLDARTKACAVEIARHHHERYDGTGYPDGLKGDEIPIEVQIVSIADAYDAIISERSYKKALSRDVALEAIANGMCGVFNPLLIECLIRVADHSQLESIRKSLLTSRAIQTDPNAMPPRKVLLLGNLRYITKQFLQDTFAQAHITMVGSCGVTSGGRVKVYEAGASDYKAILDTYDFDLIVFFAGELTYGDMEGGDSGELYRALHSLRSNGAGAKFLYLSSLDAAFEETSDRGILAAAREKVCLHWAEQSNANVKIVRIPYLYGGAVKGDYLCRLFEDLHAKRAVRMREAADSRMYFLSMTDLSDLIIRITDVWPSGDGILTVNDDFRLTFGDLGRGLSALTGGASADFSKAAQPRRLELKNTAIRKQYGWFARISILTDLQDQYESYLAAAASKATWRERLRTPFAKHSPALKIAELILLFALCELLVRATDSTMFFSIVDFRLVYIVIMATMYGLPYGVAAAALCSASWAAAKMLSGTSWLTLFYEPTNWLTFIFYFLVGALCGYVNLKKEDRIRFTQEENRLLKSRLAFTRQIYEDASNEKRDLKKQIISSKDSFGKIYDITRQLNTVDHRELYLRIIDCFEGILENKTLSVYSISAESGFGRLEVASRNIARDVSRSISLDTYAPIMEKLNRGEVWRNTGLIPNLPMFACGVYQHDRLLLLIFIWNAQAHQRSLYYVNLFRILCDLTQMFLIRAREYNQAMRKRQYVGDTILQNAEAFQNSLHRFQDLAARRVFQFLCLRVDRGGRSDEELSALLARCVRANDVAGRMEDGAVYLLLSQAGPGDLSHILPRFEALGVSVRPESAPAAESGGPPAAHGLNEGPTEESRHEMG